MTVTAKDFNALTNQEIYDLLQLRSAVFVVEQECIYQDVDGKDIKALHILGYQDDELIAYARAFKPGDYFDEASIGRVVVKQDFRSKGLAYTIMEAAMKAVKQRFGTKTIALSAQVYLKAFYNKIGFQETGEEYLEDGIPHILMVYS